MTTTIDAVPDPSVTTVSLLDGMGRATQTQLSSDPSGTTFVDTVYDGEGLVFTRSNPHRAAAALTDGTTTMYYDALGRQVKVVEPDGCSLQWCYEGIAGNGQTNCLSNKSSVANGSWTDYSDETGRHWQRISDRFGRLMAVLEPAPSGGAPTLETDYSYNALNDLAASCKTAFPATQSGAGASRTTR